MLLAAFLIGCAGVPVGTMRFEDAVTIGGSRYIKAESLCEVYGLDSYWDPISKKLTLTKDDKKLALLLNSRTVLLGETVYTMDKEARFYQGSVLIPQSFLASRLAAFFGQRPFRKEAAVAKISGPIKAVIIDPGHGGKDPGAIGRKGLREKDVVLDIAKRLKRKLNAAGIKVILTRSSDSFISLARRSVIANTNANQADFFISIHANASRSRWVSGVEVFYLSEAIDDDARAVAAAQKYQLNIKESFSGRHTAAILWDLTYRENRRSSIELAEYICRYLSKNLSQRNRGTKPARFYVLKGTNIPAVLIEVGFISNLRDEAKLNNPAYRDKVARYIFSGIAQYNRSQRR